MTPAPATVARLRRGRSLRVAARPSAVSVTPRPSWRREIRAGPEAGPGRLSPGCGGRRRLQWVALPTHSEARPDGPGRITTAASAIRCARVLSRYAAAAIVADRDRWRTAKQARGRRAWPGVAAGLGAPSDNPVGVRAIGQSVASSMGWLSAAAAWAHPPTLRGGGAGHTYRSGLTVMRPIRSRRSPPAAWVPSWALHPSM